MASNSNLSNAQASSPDEDLSLLDFLVVLLKHKRLIVGVTLGATLISAALSLLLPNVYTASATVMPPQQSQTTAAMILGQISGLAGLSGSPVGVKNPNDLYVGILKSRSVADSIIAQFDLKSLYNERSMVETREELANNTSIRTGRDGLIVIEADDEDAARAAAISNAYVDNLKRLTQTLAVTEAGQRRLFFEQQLKKAQEDLATAEIALKETQERTGLIKLDEQGRAIIEAVANLRGQIAAKEVELRAMQTYTTAENPEYVRAKQQLDGLRGELDKLERPQASRQGDILLSTGRVPQAGLEYVRKYRDVKYFETMFEVLARQFEAAKIDEAKEAAIVQVIDSAIPPDRRSKPKRALIVLAVALIAFFLSLPWVLAREMRERATTDPGLASRLDALRRAASLR